MRHDCSIHSLSFLPFLVFRLMQYTRPVPKEEDNDTAAHDLGHITAIPYGHLDANLSSLAISLPLHLHLLSLTSMFAPRIL